MPGAYWPQPWTCEDGGPRRLGSAPSLTGLDLQPGEGLEVAASRESFATDALVRRDPGELYALRHDVPLRGIQSAAVEAWAERLDPSTLEVTATTPKLPGGPFWPGGIAAHANGDLHMVFGRWAHRLSPDLDVLASHRLPVPRPHNSFVVLDTGELVTKDCDAPAGLEPSTFSVLDPESLLPVAPPLKLPEPSIARLSSDGESVIAIGTTTAFRLRLDRDAGRLVIDDDWRPSYGPAPGRSFGWDPVISENHVLWMDNGRNLVDSTMLGSGVQPDPLRLWWARRNDGAVRSTEVSGLPHGTESNPPAWDPERGVVVAYDSGNAVVRAWHLRGDELEPLWRRDGLAHAAHLIVHPDTRELVVGDWQGPEVLRRRGVRPIARAAGPMLARSARAMRASLSASRDHLVVLDLDTGEEKARVAVPSPVQGFLFSGARLRARRLLPVADDHRPGRRRLGAQPLEAAILAAMPQPLIEFPADDPERALRFWRGVLDLDLEPRAEDAGAGWEAERDGLRLGVHERGKGPGDTASLPYFTVGDMKRSLDLVAEHGGSVIHPGEQWSICRDCEGSPFALAV